MNNKLINYKKNIIISFIHLQKKFRKNKLELVRFQVGSGSRTGSGFVIPDADPQIRIRIKIKQIRNTAFNQYRTDIKNTAADMFKGVFSVGQQSKKKSEIILKVKR